MSQARSVKPRGFIEKTLADITGTLENTLFAETIARQEGLLQALDPRTKVVTFLGLLLAVSLSNNLAIIVGLYLVALGLAWASRVPLHFFIKRVWLFMPFFTGVIALPALFNVFTPGEVFVTLWNAPLIAITWPGLRTAAYLLLRVSTSVSFAVLLILTTPWTTLLKALSVLRVSHVFILILGMTHRYIFILLHTANDMFLARRSRVVGRMDSAAHRRWLTASVGTLLSKSYDLSNEVYLAMLSRGFRGQARTLDTFRLRGLDWMYGAGFFAVAGLAVYLGR